MEYLIGFVIAVFIALTGVGAGTITTPLLVLMLGVPAGIAVSVGLMFSAAVKLVLLPTQIWRKQVSWPTLGYMLVGGVPGVLAGSFLLQRFVNSGAKQLVNGTLGVVLVFTALAAVMVARRLGSILVVASRSDERHFTIRFADWSSGLPSVRTRY